MSSRDQRTGSIRRFTAAILTAALLMLSLVPSGSGTVSSLIGVTEASWIDAQHAGGTIGAGELDIPEITQCLAYNDGTFGTFSSLTLSWASALDDPDLMVLTMSSQGGAPVQVPLADIESSGPVDGKYGYTIELTSEFLNSLLGELPDTTVDIKLGTQAGTSWVSEGTSDRTLRIGTYDGELGSANCNVTQTLVLTGLVANTPAVNRVVPVGTESTSSLPPALQDRRRTPEYTATLRNATTNAIVAGAEVTIVLPDGLAFESGDFVGQSQGTFFTSATGTVVFRVVANRSESAQGVVRVESPRALSIVSAQPVASVPLVAWGYNAHFQTGSDQSGNRLSAVPLWDQVDITGATALGSSYSTLLYADQQGDLWGRGYNVSGIIGDGTTTNRSSAVAGITADGSRLGGIVQIGRGTDQLSSVAVDSDGSVWATGIVEGGGFGTGYVNTQRWQRISANLDMPADALSAQVNPFGSVLLVLSDGRAMVTGSDPYGYAAQGTTVSAAQGTRGLLMLTGAGTPIEGVVSGGIGWQHSAVVTSEGSLYTSGTAVYGGSGSMFLTEKLLPAGKAAARVVVGEYKTLVIMTDGTVYAMGTNTGGALGTGSSASPQGTLAPVILPNGAVVVDAAMGNEATLFLLDTGAVYFAGANDTGVAGAGVSGGVFYTPTRVPLAHTTLKVAATWYDTYFVELG